MILKPLPGKGLKSLCKVFFSILSCLSRLYCSDQMYQGVAAVIAKQEGFCDLNADFLTKQHSEQFLLEIPAAVVAQ